MFLRLLGESLRRGRRRKVLATAAVALGAAGATALGSVALVAGDQVAAELSGYGANLELAPAAGSTLPLAALGAVRRIFWRHNVVAVAPSLPLRARLAASGGPEVVAPLVGTWFDVAFDDGWRTGLPRTRPTLEVAGRWPRDGAAEAALGRRLAARLGVGRGGRVTAGLGERAATLAVVGIVGGGGEEEEQALLPIAVVGRLAGRPGRFARAEVFALTTPETAASRRDPRRMSAAEYDAWYCTAYPSSVAHQLAEAVPGSRATVVRGVAGATAEVLGRLRQVLAMLAVVVGLGAAVGTTAAMTATVLERRLEVGLLEAIGAERRRIVAFFLAEAAVLGAVGGLAGGGLGLVAGRLLAAAVFDLPAGWTPALLPFAVAGGVGLAVVGSLPPVVRALRGRPALLLKRATA